MRAVQTGPCWNHTLTRCLPAAHFQLHSRLAQLPNAVIVIFTCRGASAPAYHLPPATCCCRPWRGRPRPSPSLSRGRCSCVCLQCRLCSTGNGFLGPCTNLLPSTRLPLNSYFHLVLLGALVDKGSLLAAQRSSGRNCHFRIGSAKGAMTPVRCVSAAEMSGGCCVPLPAGGRPWPLLRATLPRAGPPSFCNQLHQQRPCFSLCVCTGNLNWARVSCRHNKYCSLCQGGSMRWSNVIISGAAEVLRSLSCP